MGVGWGGGRGRGYIMECSSEHYSSFEGPASKGQDDDAVVFIRGTCISQLLFVPFESVSGCARTSTTAGH